MESQDKKSCKETTAEISLLETLKKYKKVKFGSLGKQNLFKDLTNSFLQSYKLLNRGKNKTF